MAEVFRARVKKPDGTEQIYAVKKVLPNFNGDKEILRMFVEEARIAACLDHDNVVRVYDLGTNDAGEYFMVMEFADGKDLSDIIWEAAQKKLRIPTSMALQAARDVLRALEYAWSAVDDKGVQFKLIHRDISPHNVLVTWDGRIKLTDFGIAKVQASANKTQMGVIKGKFGYMSPEQARGKLLDQRSDLFNVGLLLFESFTGERLFAGSTDIETLELMRSARIPRLDPKLGISAALETLMRRALERDPGLRPQTASDFLRDLIAATQQSAIVLRTADIVHTMATLFPALAAASPVVQSPRKLALKSQLWHQPIVLAGSRRAAALPPIGAAASARPAAVAEVLAPASSKPALRPAPAPAPAHGSSSSARVPAVDPPAAALPSAPRAKVQAAIKAGGAARAVDEGSAMSSSRSLPQRVNPGIQPEAAERGDAQATRIELNPLKQTAPQSTATNGDPFATTPDPGSVSAPPLPPSLAAAASSPALPAAAAHHAPRVLPPPPALQVTPVPPLPSPPPPSPPQWQPSPSPPPPPSLSPWQPLPSPPVPAPAPWQPSPSPPPPAAPWQPLPAPPPLAAAVSPPALAPVPPSSSWQPAPHVAQAWQPQPSPLPPPAPQWQPSPPVAQPWQPSPSPPPAGGSPPPWQPPSPVAQPWQPQPSPLPPQAPHWQPEAQLAQAPAWTEQQQVLPPAPQWQSAPVPAWQPQPQPQPWQPMPPLEPQVQPWQPPAAPFGAPPPRPMGLPVSPAALMEPPAVPWVPSGNAVGAEADFALPGGFTNQPSSPALPAAPAAPALVRKPLWRVKSEHFAELWLPPPVRIAGAVAGVTAVCVGFALVVALLGVLRRESRQARTLMVRSSPAGAGVTLDGQRLAGVTPLIIDVNLADGMHILKMGLAAGAPTQRKLQLSSDDRFVIVSESLQSAGSVRIETRPAGARVLLDGLDVGAAPLTLPGVGTDKPHVLEARKQGYRNTTVTLPVERPAEHLMVLSLEPMRAAGRLVVMSTLPAHITLDGVPWGVTSTAERECPAGPHDVVIKVAALGMEARAAVEVSERAVSRYFLSFD